MGEGSLQRMVILAFVFLSCLFLLPACVKDQLDDNNTTFPPAPFTPVSPSDVRPDIPRVNVSNTLPPIVSELSPRAQVRSFLNATLFVRRAPAGIVAGDDAHPLLIGKRLGDVLPLLTRNELRLLASRQPTLRGSAVHAEPYLRFDFGDQTSGELRYVRDPDTHAVGSELFFAEGSPMLEYAYLLQDVPFLALKGEQIDVFGHDYIIHEATNHSITLYGRDVAQFLILVDGNALNVNGTSLADTEVSVDPWSFMIRYLAPDTDGDGVRLRPGEGLRAKTLRKEILLNPYFDIVYEGLDQGQNDTILLRQSSQGVRAELFNALGEPLTIRLSSMHNGTLALGGDHPLHVTECASERDFCIARDDEFLLTTNAGVTRLFALRSVSPSKDLLMLEDLGTREEHALRLVDTHETNAAGWPILDATLDLDGDLFNIAALFDVNGTASRITVDANGDRAISGAAIPIVTHALHELHVINTTHIEFVSPAIGPLDDEVLRISFSPQANALLIGLDAPSNVTLAHVKDTTTYEGMTGRGVLLTLTKSSDGILGERLHIAYPADYRAGIVRVQG